MSYWPTALPMEPMYYPTSCYDNQDLSLIHRHTTKDNHFQHGLPRTSSGVYDGTTSYGTSSLIYSVSDTTLASPPPAPAPAPAPTLPTAAPHLTITRDQAASEHGLLVVLTHVVASFVAATTLNQYAARVPVIVQAPESSTKPKAELPVGPLTIPRGHGRHQGGGSAQGPAMLQRGAQSPSSASTRTRTPTPTPLSPFLQTLTFIIYPETEAWGHRDGRDGRRQPALVGPTRTNMQSFSNSWAGCTIRMNQRFRIRSLLFSI